MPLADRVDYEDARFVGLAVNSCEPIAGHLETASQSAGFDFLAVPLANSLEPRVDLGDACSRMDFARQDMISLGDERPGSRLLGTISPWIDPDNDDIKLRRASQIALRSEVGGLSTSDFRLLLCQPLTASSAQPDTHKCDIYVAHKPLLIVRPAAETFAWCRSSIRCWTAAPLWACGFACACLQMRSLMLQRGDGGTLCGHCATIIPRLAS